MQIRQKKKKKEIAIRQEQENAIRQFSCVFMSCFADALAYEGLL